MDDSVPLALVEAMTSRKWCVMDLVVDHKTGKLRETAMWSNIGKATMTWAFVMLVRGDKLTEWYVAAYGALVVAHEIAARVMNQKQQTLDKDHGPTS